MICKSSNLFFWALIISDLQSRTFCPSFILRASLLSNEIRKLKLGRKVLDYKSKLINDQKKRFENLQIIDEEKFKTLTSEINSFDVIHPSIGENYSYLNTIRKKQNLELNYILSEEDQYSWQFSNKGYFNFKNNIPKILTSFNLQ